MEQVDEENDDIKAYEVINDYLENHHNEDYAY